MRTLVIGDIHGGLKALQQLMDKAEVTERDKLIFLGDYVDGWSEASETVNYLIELKSSYDCLFLKGNHDELCEEWLTNGEERLLWLKHGGRATINSYDKIDRATRELHLRFYADLVNFYLDDKNRLFLHAGFTNLHGVNYEYFSKNFYWDRTLWETALSLDPSLKADHPHYPKRLLHYKEIYIGHTPVTRIGRSEPYKAANVWNIDTGAAFRGPLSIIDADTKQVWQSDPVYKLYPGEMGRN